MKIRSKPSPTKTFVLGFLLLVLFAFGVFFRESVFSLASSVAEPFWQFGDEVSKTVSKENLTKSKQELREENERLRQRLASYDSLQAERDTLENQNNQLLNVLSRTNDQELVAAGVLAKPPLSPYDTFLVDAGSVLGVVLGAEVFMFGNVSIGKVVEVSSKTSKVKLYSSSDESIEVYLGTGEDSVLVRAQGEGAGGFRAEVPKGVNVTSGDRVYQPGLSKNFLGVVEHVNSSESETFQQVFITSAADVNSLDMVQIEKR